MSRVRDILRFIAEHEQLKDTLQHFPGLQRERLRGLLLSLIQEPAQPPSPTAPPVAPAPGGELWLFTDGASRGNPGLAGAGVLIVEPSGAVVLEKAVFLGSCTNNVAEYTALLLGLEAASALSPAHLKAHLDSELVVRQLNGKYRVRHPDLLPLFQRAKHLLGRFRQADVIHIPRDKNVEADRLSNQAIDQRSEP